MLSFYTNIKRGHRHLDGQNVSMGMYNVIVYLILEKEMENPSNNNQSTVVNMNVHEKEPLLTRHSSYGGISLAQSIFKTNGNECKDRIATARIKIEPKTHFANERTMLQVCLL